MMTPEQFVVFDALHAADAKDPYGVANARAKLDDAYSTLDAHLEGRRGDGWLAGETFTLADCPAAPPLHYADVVHAIDRAEHPALTSYLERLLTRPSVARVVD